MTAPADAALYMAQQELIDRLLKRKGGLGMAVMVWGCGPLTRLERRLYRVPCAISAVKAQLDSEPYPKYRPAKKETKR